jgi:uncharacterized DUF497 family protein
MRFARDEAKNRRNKTKHKVSFETAVQVFDDPLALSRLERVVDGEERWQTLGRIEGMVVLLLAHTWHEEDGEEWIRLISARKATRRGRELYEQGE